MGDPVHRDLPCRYPQVRFTPLSDSELDSPHQQIGSVRLGIGHARRTHTSNGSLRSFHVAFDMCSPIPTRTDPIQTEAEHCCLCLFHEGGLSKDCRTCIPSNSLFTEIFVSGGAAGHERVSFLHGDPLGLISIQFSVLNLSTFGPPLVRRSRLTRHLRRISQDDALLEQEGLGQRLTLPELQEALDERGL